MESGPSPPIIRADMSSDTLGQRGEKIVKMADSGSSDLWRSPSAAQWKPERMSSSNETDEYCC